MNTIGFWTATVAEKNILTRDTPTMVPERTMQTRVDDYFFIAGKKAFVLFHESAFVFDKDETKPPIKFIHFVVLLPSNSPVWLTVLKIISYCTVIIPLIMLGLKICCRCIAPYHHRAKKRIPIEYSEKTPEEIGIKISTDSKSGVTTILTNSNSN